jgi:hypothetical protein
MHQGAARSTVYGSRLFIPLSFLALVFSLFYLDKEPQEARAQASGPLRVLSSNPRYFTDGSGRAVYLTGSHTWNVLADLRSLPVLNFGSYLDFLNNHNHNFLRLWSNYRLEGLPVPYVRSGPGTALDGYPRVDLERLDQEYFDRLRARAIAARDRGIYVNIMLFNSDGAKSEDWSEQFFHPSNNIQGINGDSNGDGRADEVYDLSNSAITTYQEAYVRKIIDTVNDLDNVVYEVGNEGFQTSTSWQYHLINFIRDYEARKPKRHVIGMTSFYDSNNQSLYSSPADWVSPADVSGQDYSNDPPANNGDKVGILDTDHLLNNNEYGASNEADGAWIWKSFLRGYNPILMDRVGTTSAKRESARSAMGHTKTYADKMNLASMTPRGDLTSTGYALANPGSEYLIYSPQGGSFTVDLPADSGYVYEWFNPISGYVTETGSVTTGEGGQSFSPPFGGDAVLYLHTGSGGPSGSTACHFYDSSQSISTGFGASYNAFSGSQELLLKAFCTDTSVSYPIGNGSSYLYIYNQGYYWTGSNWQNFTLSCSNLVSNAWCVGSGSHTRSLTQSQRQSTNPYVAYVCNWTGSDWKCGCRDSACTTNYWNLQALKKQ